MAKSKKSYRKRVQSAVKGFCACKYTVCKDCPFRSQGCKAKLYEEALDLLTDYYNALRQDGEPSPEMRNAELKEEA